MGLITAVLTYRPHGTGGTETVPIGSTDESRVLRLLRDVLVEEARLEAEHWRAIDPGVFAMRAGEVARLVNIIAILLPESYRGQYG